MITIFAPRGVGEIEAGADLAGQVVEAVARDAAGPLLAGDIVVITSKVVSKASGRTAPASTREAEITAATERTVARRGPTRIVRTHVGLTMAAAGVDASNVSAGTIVLLPVDPDADAADLRAELQRRTGLPLGVVISDTAGRAWRIGQTDHAIGASGVRVVERYAGRLDAYGNELQVTETALADELAAAADLAKAKLAGRPFAVVRGLGQLVEDSGAGAAELVRPVADDLFGLGTAEAVLAAVLVAIGRPERYEELVAAEPEHRADRLLASDGPPVGTEVAGLIRALLSVDLRSAGGPSKSR